jgi:N-carbamoyl-L-amino-acid hydrolase
MSVWDRLMALAAIGDTGDGGVNRQALTPGEAEAWRLLLRWTAEAGMEAATDDAANLFLTRPGRDRALPPILLGSHIDTQPTGGKFDGAFGVISAFEAVAALPTPPRDVTVVAWMNEEGSRFAPGMMGSEAFSGYRPIEAIRACRDAAGVSAGEAIDAHLAQFPDLRRRPFGFPVAAYIEPHIEQGPLLEAAATPIGIVTGIQGKITWEIVLTGAEGHAGTLDMADRRDAVVAFARTAAEMQRLVGKADPIVKLTIGMVKVEPNAPSVVPGRVTFRIDLRHPDNAALQAAGTLLEATAARLAAPCTAQITRLVDAPSNDFDPGLRARIARAADKLGIKAMPILSAAGHDARHMAPRCPSAMIFIPCRDGISHSPLEWSEPADVAAGAAVLAETLRTLLDEDA